MLTVWKRNSLKSVILSSCFKNLEKEKNKPKASFPFSSFLKQELRCVTVTVSSLMLSILPGGRTEWLFWAMLWELGHFPPGASSKRVSQHLTSWTWGGAHPARSSVSPHGRECPSLSGSSLPGPEPIPVRRIGLPDAPDHWFCKRGPWSSSSSSSSSSVSWGLVRNASFLAPLKKFWVCFNRPTRLKFENLWPRLVRTPSGSWSQSTEEERVVKWARGEAPTVRQCSFTALPTACSSSSVCVTSLCPTTANSAVTGTLSGWPQQP